MEHIAAVLLIVGCSPAFTDCRELPAQTPLFETQEECEALLPEALAQHRLGGGSRKIAGACVFVDPAAEEEDAQLVWEVSPHGVLDAEVVSGSVMARDGTSVEAADAF